MNFKTCFALVLAAVVATAVSADDSPLYCQAVGCPTLYSEANLAISQQCRNEGNTGEAFHSCCVTKCGAPK
ncbi:hypothetical protein PF005_g9976 [Phytophthora fragariae]|uniref:Phytotoxin PcF domain-containing protein n=1 Tax=Phytophthora fragariae TaxID=53985 RepID=A0A6A3KJD7_9STRA|nr:hypothetical protein PF003_g442 [Phytophthora fragariae]KAE8939205.1 hypothetical protein PF009_g10947 [Phytophthora fragariae]KAE9005947.1 hypothetical protein PF011_g11811 [Phytophthora fragariae]KAE9120121.1 hypothetical protein PF007_g8284 [Phytophthora fragariae]KAE9139213.1 hypothetical protein PF010_g683 [Phytophthora fragariae]